MTDIPWCAFKYRIIFVLTNQSIYISNRKWINSFFSSIKLICYYETFGFFLWYTKSNRNIHLLFLYLNNFSCFAGDFTVFADISKTGNGFPRLQYEGYTFGRRKCRSNENTRDFGADNIQWICTRSDRNKKRCTAKMLTKVIDGYVMMRVKNPHHICN